MPKNSDRTLGCGSLLNRGRFCVLCGLGLAAMFVLAPFDFAWTRWLTDHEDQRFVEIMSRSMFEGEGIGGTDPFTLALGILGIFYVVAQFRPEQSALGRHRRQLGFIFTVSLFQVYFVHTVKWIMARPRPRVVFKGELPFAHWFEIGEQFIANGTFRGSFPSGHTSVIATFVVFSYVIWGVGSVGRRRCLALALGAAIVVSAALMGFSRIMGGTHWPSDCLASILFCLASTHVIYTAGLRMPESLDIGGQGEAVRRPMFWEARICFFAFLVCLGVLATQTGIRAVLLPNRPWLIVLAIPGTAMAVFGTIRCRKLGFFREWREIG